MLTMTQRKLAFWVGTAALLAAGALWLLAGAGSGAEAGEEIARRIIVYGPNSEA
ncbi:hypothetical protein [Paenibacillus antri]|uniref:hypothetical protein n=1 Tax=Paenibacillus antri TaxID=2582848 RepID=UPI001305300F|nr:hypothetical protein [Paenibacillus antri]